MINPKANEILNKAVVNKDSKAILVKIPHDQYLEVLKKKAAMSHKSANSGDVSNVTMNAFVLAALEAFKVESN